MAEPMRKRDPERRKREIIAGAVAVVLREGPEALTHRKVAAEAGVPLGSTTQHFSTLDDLRSAALRAILERNEEWLAELEERFVRDGASPAAYARALAEYLADHELVSGDFALVCAAPSHPEVMGVGRAWSVSVTVALERYISAAAAAAISAYSDGIAMQMALLDIAPDTENLTAVIAALWEIA